MAGHLPRRLGGLLHARPPPDDHAPGGHQGRRPVAAARCAVLLLDLDQGRERASAAGRHLPAQIPLRPPARSADRADLGVLAAPSLAGRLTHALYARQWLLLERIRRDIRRDPLHKDYMDEALAPVTDDEEETLELFTHNEGARHAVEHARKVAALTHGASAPAEAAA
jgi:hypothetical protein